MPSIESAVIRVVVDVSESLADRLADKLKPKPLDFSIPEAGDLLNDLGTEADKLLCYLDSPDFAAVAAQYRVRATPEPGTDDQVYQGLRLAGLPERCLEAASRVVRQVLILACEEVAPLFREHRTRIDQRDVAAAAATTSRMLKRLKSHTRFHSFAARMREQVVALHNTIRLPHIGVSRAVRYSQLYVQPGIDSTDKVRLGSPGDRTVILGDPGAGKSTFATKFAHDIASDESGRVPFLMVLREFTGTFGEGGHDLLHYLEMLCKAPYNVKSPQDGIEYLLRTGRAVVVLDGLDEVVQTELRRRVVALVEGFAHLYPLVPVLVTARRVGYEDAPLNGEQFATAYLREFTERQVKTYVRRWFVLDEATSPAERKRLTTSFIEDSDQIVELRNNPLLLALLCAMYSSDRYLPRNLAQVYERCALMLFEQWDARRGIPLPLKFHGRLRGAVQYLAWKMFTAPESGKALPRTRIVNALTQYLEDKLDDHDESVATAEEFLAFCTGRAWVLTDVGATDTETQFGFTHRTFLEYFAAEHLVRTHRSAADLWAMLLPNISQWEVVAQIALQLYDRNVEGGADELLTEALNEGGLDFAARSLHYVHPSSRTVRNIAEQALRQSVLLSVANRAILGSGDIIAADAPLVSCMHECSPANLAAVEQTVAPGLAALLREGDPGAIILLELMLSVPTALTDHEQRWSEIQQELRSHHATAIAERAAHSPWGALQYFHDADMLCQLIRHFGVRALYVNWNYHRVIRSSPGLAYLGSEVSLYSDDSVRLLATTMAEQPTPWASIDEFSDASDLLHEWHSRTDCLSLMLSLPFLELKALDRPVRPPPSMYAQLIRSRKNADELRDPLRWIQQAELPVAASGFLESWVRGEISVLAPDPEPPPPLLEQR